MPVTFDTDLQKRRVPDSARRRALVSCDRCKMKRIRCARSNQESPCEACQRNKFACRSTIPRKRMISSASDSDGLRREALDALVRGLFPTEDCDNIETVLRLGTERGIAMPDIDTLSSTVHCPPTTHVPAPDQTQATRAEPTSYNGHSSSETHLETPTPVSQTMDRIQWPCNIDPTIQGAVIRLPEETCIPAPHGVAHYVGPASSFEFATAVRRLVTLRGELLDDPRNGHDRRSKLRADFTNLKTSIALEPRIGTHPASTVREQAKDKLTVDNPTSPMRHDDRTSRTESDGASRSAPTTRNSLRSLLPTRGLSEKLIGAFFAQLHPNYVLFHRGMFYTRYESVWQNSPPSSGGQFDPGWLCSLFLVYVFGAQLLENELGDAVGLQRKFLRLVQERFHHLAITASLANVQALLLLQLYEHNAGERNTAWLLLGQAARMAIALGMHREGAAHHFDTIERNTRRMVWFTLYSFEQYSSLVLGRPSTIKALEVNIQLPDEAVVDGNDHPPDYFTYSSALLALASKVRHFATASSPNCFDARFLTSMLESLNIIAQELRDWNLSLPQHLRPEWPFISPRHLRAVLLLHMNYHYISSVLTRPYLLCTIEHEITHQSLSLASSSSTPSTDINRCAQECTASSIAVAEMLHLLESASLLDGTGWIDFFYLYHAMLALCLNFLARPQLLRDEWTVQDREIRARVSAMIDMCQTHQLAPTYRILSKVAIQFSHIVGLASDHSQSRADSDMQASQGTSLDGKAQEGANNTANTVAAAQQHDVFMPYTEPISGIAQFNDENAFWDFFNVNGLDPSDSSANLPLQYMASTFEDSNAYSTWYGRPNDWPL